VKSYLDYISKLVPLLTEITPRLYYKDHSLKIRKIITVYCDHFMKDVNNSLREDAVIVNVFEVGGI